MNLIGKEFVEMAKMVYLAYPMLNENYKFSEALSAIDHLHKNIFVIKENHKLMAIALYFMVDDITLNRIKWFVYDLRKPGVFEQLKDRKGGHLHIVGLVSIDGNANIKRWMTTICDKLRPKTISWFKRDYTELVLKEVR